jgi:prolyl-tRNA editing enzyme YbaK/EbsC (Cys-tRNA(Pro) deacylase)
VTGAGEGAPAGPGAGPEASSARIDERVESSLRALGIPYERMACDPDLADTAAFCAHYGVAPERTGNTIIVASKREPRRHAACLVLATTRLDVNHTVTRLLGEKKLSFASAEETRRVTGMMVGGVTVFGLPEGMPLYIDSRVMRLDEVLLGGGSRSWKVRIAPSALLRLPQASVIEGLAQEV